MIIRILYKSTTIIYVYVMVVLIGTYSSGHNSDLDIRILFLHYAVTDTTSKSEN